ncbi:MAG: HlyD family efflux transporter periplasmic adaptor subunit [Burkholderiales bacterium]|nr:HlyD family efflux transporter periplasmic adaptor subunit [Burkholderiales bacterium]
MKRSTMIGAAAAAALALGLLAWAFAPRPLAVELATATVGPFESTIDEDARTRLAERYVVSAPLAARLARITLKEGDEVKSGDVVARLQPVLTPLLDERSWREQVSRAEGAQAALAQAGKRVEAARVALERARDDLRRSEQLSQQGFVAPTKLTSDRLAVQAAQKELEAAAEGEHVARHELEQSRVALGVVRAGAASGQPFEVRSPIDGRVLKVNVASEATVALGTPLLELGDVSQLEIVAELLTTDALQAAPGSAVRIERWGGPTALQGRVRRVDPAAFTKVSALGVEEQRVNVVIDITSPRAQWAALGDGYRVGVRVVTRSEPQVLTVPVGAVFPAAATDAAPGAAAGNAVFVADGSHARLRSVQVQARNGNIAWITSGLKAGERVLVYPPAAVVDGSRIAERR